MSPRKSKRKSIKKQNSPTPSPKPHASKQRGRPKNEQTDTKPPLRRSARFQDPNYKPKAKPCPKSRRPSTRPDSSPGPPKLFPYDDPNYTPETIISHGGKGKPGPNKKKLRSERQAIPSPIDTVQEESQPDEAPLNPSDQPHVSPSAETDSNQPPEIHVSTSPQPASTAAFSNASSIPTTPLSCHTEGPTSNLRSAACQTDLQSTVTNSAPLDARNAMLWSLDMHRNLTEIEVKSWSYVPRTVMGPLIDSVFVAVQDHVGEFMFPYEEFSRKYYGTSNGPQFQHQPRRYGSRPPSGLRQGPQFGNRASRASAFRPYIQRETQQPQQQREFPPVNPDIIGNAEPSSSGLGPRPKTQLGNSESRASAFRPYFIVQRETTHQPQHDDDVDVGLSHSSLQNI